MFKKIKLGWLSKRAALSALLLTFSVNVLAALPTPVAPSLGKPKGDWLTLIKGYIKDGGLVLGLAVAVVSFLWIAWITIAKFNEARAGKAEWGEVGLTAVMAAGVMIFISFLLTEASNVI